MKTQSFFVRPRSEKCTGLWLGGVVPTDTFLQIPYVAIGKWIDVSNLDSSILTLSNHLKCSYVEDLEEIADNAHSVVVCVQKECFLDWPEKNGMYLYSFVFRRVTGLVSRLFSRFQYEIRQESPIVLRIRLTQAEAEDFVRALRVARDWLATEQTARALRMSSLPEVL